MDINAAGQAMILGALVIAIFWAMCTTMPR